MLTPLILPALRHLARIAAILTLLALGACDGWFAGSADAARDRLAALQAENRDLGHQLAMLSDRLAVARLTCPLRPPPDEAAIEDDRLAAYTPPPPPPPEKPAPPPRPAPSPPIETTRAETPRTEVGNELTLPDSPTGNMAFLEGCWQSEPFRHRILQFSSGTSTYCFDANGNGQLTFRRDSHVCRAPASARMNGSQLYIQDADTTCSDGSQWFQDRLNCRNEGGKAVCDGRSAQNTRWRSTLRRTR